MLAVVVSRVRRHLRSQKSTSDSSKQIAPDLRRWSSFETPFPHIRFGGYLRYYETQAATQLEYRKAQPGIMAIHRPHPL